MATVTTGGSGDWNSTTNNAPWPGGTIPAITDLIEIADGTTLTIPSGYTAKCGDPANPTAFAIRTVGTGGTGILINEGTFEFRSAVRQGNATWRLKANSITRHDNASNSCDWLISDANGQSNAVLSLEGTDASNEALFESKSGSANFGGFHSGEATRDCSTNYPGGTAKAGGGRIESQWGRFLNLGLAGTSWLTSYLDAQKVFFRDTLVQSCSGMQFHALAAAGAIEFKRFSILDPIATNGISQKIETFVTHTGADFRGWEDCIIEGNVEHAVLVDDSKYVATRTAFAGTTSKVPYYTGGGGDTDLPTTDVLFFNRMNAADGSSTLRGGTHTRLVSLRANSNEFGSGEMDHFRVFGAARDYTINDFIAETDGAAAQGSDIIVLEGGAPASMKYCRVNGAILVPQVSGLTAGVLISMLVDTTNYKVSAEKVTRHIVSGGTADVNAIINLEGIGTWIAGACDYCRNNLTTRGAAGTVKLIDFATQNPPDGTVVGADYNIYYNVTGGNGYDGVAADYASPSPAGGNDSSINPSYVDASRNFLSWAASIDAGVTTWPLAWAEIRKRNNRSGYNSAWDWVNYYSYIRAGFTPTNTAINTAGNSGGRVGAVDAASSSAVKRKGFMSTIAPTKERERRYSLFQGPAQLVTPPVSPSTKAPKQLKSTFKRPEVERKAAKFMLRPNFMSIPTGGAPIIPGGGGRSDVFWWFFRRKKR